MARCAAAGCSNTETKNNNLTFFTLPKEKKIAVQWLTKIKRENGVHPNNRTSVTCIELKPSVSDTLSIFWPWPYLMAAIASYPGGGQLS